MLRASNTQTKKIIAVFQPHTFSRTVALMDEFAKSLDLADKVYLTDIFSSIREHDGKVSAKDLGEKITKGRSFSSRQYVTIT